jgi:hypothetical protein
MRVTVVVAVLAWAVSVNALTVNTNQLKKKEFGMVGIDALMNLVQAVKEAVGAGTDSPQQEIIDLLKDKGYSDKAIAGILGNIELETGGTFDYQQKEKGKGEGYGLFQFDPGGMLPYYNKYLEESGMSDSAVAQIDFMDKVAKGEITYFDGERDAPILGGGNVNKLQESFNKDNVAEIAKDFNKLFEKGKMETEYGKRDELAEKNYSLYF